MFNIDIIEDVGVQHLYAKNFVEINLCQPFGEIQDVVKKATENFEVGFSFFKTDTSSQTDHHIFQQNPRLRTISALVVIIALLKQGKLLSNLHKHPCVCLSVTSQVNILRKLFHLP